MSASDLRVHAIITGRVQGVGFRYFVLMSAVELDLRGYVRNAGRGVEVVAEGDPAALEQLLKRLHQGPSAARVENVQASRGPSSHGYTRFEVRASG